MSERFDAFVSAAWDEHAANAERVAARLEEGLNVIEDTAQIPHFAALVTHVFGEHLGAWQRGITLLESLGALPAFANAVETPEQVQADAALARSRAALALAASPDARCDDFARSDRARILAVAASALAARHDARRASELFGAALAVASELGKDDPAQRALAVTANNLAAELEEKIDRRADERALMLHAARTAREKWELVGTWIHVERAEYRLCKSHLAAGDPVHATEHARTALAICRDHADHPLELFSALEAVARAAHASRDTARLSEARTEATLVLEQLPGADRAYARQQLEALEALTF